jgi:hypothetical protein
MNIVKRRRRKNKFLLWYGREGQGLENEQTEGGAWVK